MGRVVCLVSGTRLRSALVGKLAGTLLFCIATDPARLESQTTTSGIGGTIRDSTGAVVANVTVEARHRASGYVARTATNSAGRYTLLGLPLGGPYIVQARRVGFIAAVSERVLLTMSARPTVDFILQHVTTQLAALAIRADAGRESSIGGSTRVDRAQIDALPVVDRNFAGLAALNPLAGPQLSLGGQRWTSTDLRIDGVQSRNLLRAGETNGGPTAISLEAIREFEVNTAVFDVGQGRQGGGQIAAVTRAGTNEFNARLFGAYRNERLSAATDFQGRTRRARTAQFAQSALSLSGPVARNRAHYFLVYERQDASEPLVTGDVGTRQAQLAASIAADSLSRVLGVLRARYGTAESPSQLGRLTRRPLSQTFFARADWQLSAAHRAMLRLTASDWSSPLSGGVDQPITLREARSSFASQEQGLLSSLTSRIGAAHLNELQLAVSASRRTLTPESPGVPRGFVQVRSLLPDGTTGNSTIQFGGNRLAPDDSREWQLQLLDRFSMQHGRVLYTIGTDNSLVGTRTLIAEAQSGLFVFPSIAALEAGQANRFTRTAPVSGPSPVTRQHVIELGLYTQAEWQPHDRFTFTTGLRWDGTAFLAKPQRNQDVDRAFGVNTSRAPRDLAQLQPRGQAEWRVGARHQDVLRFGAGLFAAQLPYYAGHNALLYTGTSLVDIDLRGASVPAPMFQRYRSDPAAVPGVPTGGAPAAAYVNVSGNVRAPRTFKAAGAWSHTMRDALTATLGVQASRMRDGYHYIDLNLRDTPAFRLSAEGNRGVWVPPTTIAAGTGVTDVRDASRVAGFSRVVSLESGARAEQLSATAEVAFRIRQSVRGTLGYAWSRARDNSTYGCCLARTATTFTPVVDDPRDLAQAWAASDFDARHRLVGALIVRAPYGFSVSARYAGMSGRPFSLVVDGDINGDEANGNDLAFLFDPADARTPVDVAASMRRIMSNPGNLAGRYIREHLGAVAARNAVYTPWTNRVDARLSRLFPLGHGTVQTAELFLDIFNVGNLLNRDWGAQYLLPAGISSQNPVVNRVPLLRVVGFDATERRYRYTVNETAGVLPKSGDPFQLQVGLRLDR